MNKKILSWLAGIITISGIEIIIWQPHVWPIVSLVMLGLLTALVFLLSGGQARIRGAIIGLTFLVAPALTVLFFIDNIWWQHILGIISGVVVYYYFFVLFEILTRGKTQSRMILPLLNIFFSTAAMLGLVVFLRLPLYLALILLICLVGFYPFKFRIINKSHDAARLPIPSLEFRYKQYYLWLPEIFLTQHKLNQEVTITIPGLKLEKRIIMFKIFLVLLVVELFIIFLTLPTNILIGASVISIIIFCLVSLVNLEQLKILTKALLMRYLSLSALFIILIFLTARWS